MRDRLPATRERILEAAEGLMLEKSYHSVGLKEILEAVRVPKGSFYHYFPSKEQFGVELLRHYVAGATAAKREQLFPSGLEEGLGSPLERLMQYFAGCWKRTADAEGRCPVSGGEIGFQVAGMSEPMREVLAEGVREWVGLLEKLIREGMESGVMHASMDPAVMASVVHDLWTGAMQRAATNRSALPLEEAHGFIRQLLAGKLPSAPGRTHSKRADPAPESQPVRC